MNTPIWLVIYILFLHWLGDFVAQTRKQGNGKSSSNELLLEHICNYAGMLLVGLMIVCLFTGTANGFIVYTIVNVFIHFFVDYMTSRASKAGKEHLFWCTIGFDQFLHVACLVGTLFLMEV